MIKTNQNIVIIGMPGSGKSTIGKLLAKKLKMKFCDVDTYIELYEGVKISEIFKSGEANFRTVERSAVERVSLVHSTVISTGGGVIKDPINMQRLKKNGIIIFIDRPIEQIFSDVDIAERPLLKDQKEKIYELYEERYALYKEYCDKSFVNNLSIKNTVDEILRYLRN